MERYKDTEIHRHKVTQTDINYIYAHKEKSYRLFSEKMFRRPRDKKKEVLDMPI